MQPDDVNRCECTDDEKCDGCLRDMEAEWRIEHEKVYGNLNPKEW